MNYIIILFVLFIVIVLFLSGTVREKANRGVQNVVGICNIALDRTLKKRNNKQKILEFLKKRGEANNSDIREILGISRRSVARYMEELEKEGDVEQVGDIGRGVVYRIKSQSEK